MNEKAMSTPSFSECRNAEQVILDLHLLDLTNDSVIIKTITNQHMHLGIFNVRTIQED